MSGDLVSVCLVYLSLFIRHYFFFQVYLSNCISLSLSVFHCLTVAVNTVIVEITVLHCTIKARDAVKIVSGLL